MYYLRQIFSINHNKQKKMNNQFKKSLACRPAIAKATMLSVFAITTTATISLLCSCNDEEEYYQNGNYTLARKRMTRSVEGLDDGENASKPKDDPTMYYDGGDIDKEIIIKGLRITFNISWPEGRWNFIKPHLTLVSCDN